MSHAALNHSARLVLPRLLLLKSDAKHHGKFMHSGKHALYGNPPRWHAVTADKPAPKGAPVAAHPMAAGSFSPAQHFTDEQWAALKLPDSNVNAPSYNKALDKLKAWSDAGSVTAIIGAGYGSNTYGQKLAKVANHLLGLHGSAHKVAAGQKAGEHTAVQSGPTEAHPSGLPEHLAPKVTPGLQEPGGMSPLAQHVKDSLDQKAADGDVEFIKLVAANNPEHPQIVAYAQQKLAELEAKAPSPSPALPDLESPEDMAATYKSGKQVPSAAIAMPDFQEGKTTTGVKAYYEKQAQKVIDHGLAGNAAVLEDMKADGLKPSAKGKVTNTWLGKTANSKKPLALHAAALAHASGGSGAATDQSGDPMPVFQTYSEANDWAKSHAKEKGLSWKAYTASSEYKDHVFPALAQLYHSAKAGWDAENAETGKKMQAAMADAGVKPGDTVSWTQVGSFLSQTKMSGVVKLDGNGVPFVHLTTEVAVSKPGGKIGYAKKLRWQPYMAAAVPTAPKAPLDQQMDDESIPLPSGIKTKIDAMDAVELSALVATHSGPGGFKKILAYAQAKLAAATNTGPKEGDTKPGADGKNLVFKDGRWHKYVAADEHGELPPALVPVADPTPDTGPITPQQLQNLQSIPWYKLKLPAENTNAKSHNAALAKIEAMAFAGDTAGLQAFIDAKGGAKQTYAKKQVLTAQTALAGLQVQGATAAVPVGPAPAPAPAQEQSSALTRKQVAGLQNWLKVGQPTSKHPDSWPNLWKKLSPATKASIKAVMAPAAPTIGQDEKKVMDELAAGEHWVDLEDLAEMHGPGTPAGAYAIKLLRKKPSPDELDAKATASAKASTATASTPLSAQQLAAPESLSLADLEAIDHSPGLPLNVQAWIDKKIPELNQASKPKTVSAPKTILHNTLPGHSKSWSVYVAPNASGGFDMVTEHGKIGGTQQKTVKSYPTHAEAGDAAAALKNTKFKKGYVQQPTDYDHMVPAPGAAAQPPSPKEGDTKQGADGMLVLKNGHWVKVGGEAPEPDAHPSMDAWTKIGLQGGSNPGGKFRDPSGQEWYCKWPSDPDAIASEVLAAKLYALAGLSSQDCMVVTKGGKPAIATKWVNIKKAGTAAALAKTPGALDGFAVDAWLGNWDVVGQTLDNLQVGPDGKAHRVDAGGSLEYRAQGEKKPFGSSVDEIDTLRDAAKNPQAAAVFGKIKQTDLIASVAKVAAISDVAIRAMVNEHGPGDAAAKKKLADTLIARKKDLLTRFPKAAKAKKKPTFDPSQISAPPSFLNWGGSGKSGPSSKEFLNKANDDAVQAVFAAAKTGSMDAIKNLTAPVFDKDTGAVTGQKPVLDHPSQHVKGYAQQAVNEINAQLNPPKKFRFDGGHPLHALNNAYPAHAGAKSSALAQKLGKFIVLGEPGVVKLEEVGLPAKIKHAEGGGTLSTGTYAAAAKAAFHKMPATQKQAVQSYTGSSYHAMNGSLWSGNPSGAAKAAEEALKTLGRDIQPGTVLSRKINLHGEDLQQLLGAQGKVLQEPAIMSTSIRPSSWSGNVHLKLHVGPGVKGLWVGQGSNPSGGAISKHGGEDEMVLPPNTRLMVLSVKAGGSKDADGFGQHSSHVIECVILPTQ